MAALAADRLPAGGRPAVSELPQMPLEGIQVVEAATLFAAPLAAMLLGDYGADVIKIEHPHRVDPARGHGPSKDGDRALVQGARAEQAAGHARPLEARPGRDIFLRLAERSDVVLENFRPGTLERWGVGRDELSAVEPAARARARQRLRPDRPVRPARRLRHARRGDERLRRAQRRARRAAAAPAARARRRRHGARDRVRDHGRAAGARADRSRPDRRHLAGRAAADAARAAADRLRPARRAAAAHGQPLEPQRAAQRLPDGRRLLGRGLVERDLDRRARDGARRPARSGCRAPWFATGSGRAEHVDEIDDAVAVWIGERTRDEVLAAFEVADARSRRSTTPATCSPTRSSKRSARSAPSTTRSSGRCGCRT